MFERWFYTMPLRLRSRLRRGRVEQELDEEFRYHQQVERTLETIVAVLAHSDFSHSQL